MPLTTDLTAYQAMFENSAFIERYGVALSRANIADILEADLAIWMVNGFGPWVILDQESGEVMGRGGLKTIQLNGQREVELCYALLPKFWHQGKASQLVADSIQFAFQQLALSSLIAFTLPSNMASRKILEKFHFKFEYKGEYKGLMHQFYRLSKERC